jgi:hypothetical protein
LLDQFLGVGEIDGGEFGIGYVRTISDPSDTDFGAFVV